ncbi:MAG: exodeoxyribonuclease VII small subunit [Planctomycetota bacterium]
MTPPADDGDAPASSTRPAETTQPASFEDALNQLAELVSRLESGSLGLSASIDGYERGVALLRRLHEELARAEERVSVLVRIDDEGRPVLAPLEAAEQPGGDQSTPRRSRQGGRSKQPHTRALPGMDEASEEA